MRWIVMLTVALAVGCGAHDGGPAEVHVDTGGAALACGTISHWVCHPGRVTEITVNPDGSETWTISAPSCYSPETGPCSDYFEHVVLEGAVGASERAAEYREILSQICQEHRMAGRRLNVCIGGGVPLSVPIYQPEPDEYCDRIPVEHQYDDRCDRRPIVQTCPAGQKLAGVECPAYSEGDGPGDQDRHGDYAVAEAIEGACTGGVSATTRNATRVNCP